MLKNDIKDKDVDLGIIGMIMADLSDDVNASDTPYTVTEVLTLLRHAFGDRLLVKEAIVTSGNYFSALFHVKSEINFRNLVINDLERVIEELGITDEL